MATVSAPASRSREGAQRHHGFAQVATSDPPLARAASLPGLPLPLGRFITASPWQGACAAAGVTFAPKLFPCRRL
jgi:hypothetical protein